MTKGHGRVVVVSGGTRGIGRAITEHFRRLGETVAICSRSPRDPSLPMDIWHRQVDVRDRAAMRLFLHDVVERFGRLDVLVNCAGVSRWRSVEDLDEPLAEEIIATSLLGTLWGCAASAPLLSRDGCIVNVSSLAGKRGSANNSAYCAAKFAVNGITQALAKELGPRGIRVNAVCPVYVETEQLLEALSQRSSPAQEQGVGQYLKTFAATQTALGRLPTQEEVAAVVLFLASGAASAVTGQCLNVDCGTLPQ
ncbi:MAG: SDR family oxidoreductase [Candidatus Omnitrophica bacterium]|nr:SDR family oxidoreductase [Candidatus Omnitrophota bacterium]